MSANGFKSVVDIDLLGTFNTCRAAFEHLKRPGASIVNISAMQAFTPMPMQAHVCAAKAGVDMLTKCLAIEWGPEGVRVNSIAPGAVDETEGMRRLAPTPEIRKHYTQSIPLRRFARKEEIAELALFLSSEALAVHHRRGDRVRRGSISRRFGNASLDDDAEKGKGNRVSGIIRRVAVFCGSNPGARPEYVAAAKLLGRTLASRGIGLVYGGSNVGLMAALADAMMDELGDVIGVIPRMLVEREVANTALSDLRIVGSMHERKALMAELADGFIALPGGIGTLEEFFETWTWAQLGMHAKPCGLLNVAGYFDPLLAFLDRSVEEKFVRAVHRQMVIVEDDPVTLLKRFEAYEPPQVVKWVNAGTI